MNYRLAIFDMDGTILDTLKDLTDSTNCALKQMDYPPRTMKEINDFIGNGVGILIKKAVPEGTSEEDYKKTLEKFKRRYEKHSMDSTLPYPGITELLKELRTGGCLTAVVSNKIDSAVKLLADEYFPSLFDCTLGERPETRRKPWPDMCEQVLMALRIDKEDAVYIGDTEVDMKTAKNAGLDFIGAGWGFRGVEFLRAHGSKRVAETAKDVAKWIL